jgi:murein DD-endopeptidase MepM/ murein hydrolase activator NlpD
MAGAQSHFKPRTGASRPAKAASSGRPPHPARGGRGGRGAVLVAWIACAVALAWAAGATWLVLDGRRTVAALADERGELRRSYDEKIKALTRRLVGVASSQIIEQDGLEGRMADLITRQVELEARQGVVGGLADEARAALKPGGLHPAPPGRSDATPERKPGRDASGLTEPLAAVGRLFAQLPKREQLAHLQHAMDRLDAAQTNAVDEVLTSAQSRAGLLRAAVREFGLEPPRAERSPARRLFGLPARAGTEPTDQFAASVQAAKRALDEMASLIPKVEPVPYRFPLFGQTSLSSNFGVRTDPFTGAQKMHAGMDFRAPTGTPVHAAAAGRVVTAGTASGYGNLVEIAHVNGLATRYGHLSEIDVKTGETVAAGALIGLVGSTGRSTGPHLHYETRIAGVANDPVRFLRVGIALYAADQGIEVKEADPAELAAD